MHYDEALFTPYPGCGSCIHVNTDNSHGPDDRANWTCKAFPGGIPHEIANFKASHDQPYPGDNGIRYKGRIIVPEGKKIGYYYDFEGDAHDAETHEIIEWEAQVR